MYNAQRPFLQASVDDYLQTKSRNSTGGATIQLLSSGRKKQEAGDPGAEASFEVDGQ